VAARAFVLGPAERMSAAFASRSGKVSLVPAPVITARARAIARTQVPAAHLLHQPYPRFDAPTTVSVLTFYDGEDDKMRQKRRGVGDSQTGSPPACKHWLPPPAVRAVPHSACRACVRPNRSCRACVASHDLLAVSGTTQPAIYRCTAVPSLHVPGDGAQAEWNRCHRQQCTSKQGGVQPACA